jgi:hypothetical protein
MLCYNLQDICLYERHQSFKDKTTHIISLKENIFFTTTMFSVFVAFFCLSLLMISSVASSGNDDDEDEDGSWGRCTEDRILICHQDGDDPKKGYHHHQHGHDDENDGTMFCVSPHRAAEHMEQHPNDIYGPCPPPRRKGCPPSNGGGGGGGGGGGNCTCTPFIGNATIFSIFSPLRMDQEVGQINNCPPNTIAIGGSCTTNKELTGVGITQAGFANSTSWRCAWQCLRPIPENTVCLIPDETFGIVTVICI